MKILFTTHIQPIEKKTSCKDSVVSPANESHAGNYITSCQPNEFPKEDIAILISAKLRKKAQRVLNIILLFLYFNLLFCLFLFSEVAITEEEK